ncbi:hypothetical protein HU200_046379 [Digitaria exilis]|uniref:Uncharacterized protein n=1 Tax=Digitaria exilis TaxID=1010633 RepID=A0A835B169_9POAL|nr:hypothetical protein HU200_046377 [Digitaria exilis]KAF8677894.1 hypothetical protein HU200_046378 [Digitaria exilis]KAF8677895.1 hypothetical protein HU200_046379 [Digitaria exilis]
MEDRRRRHLAPNDDDDDLVELPAADKPRHPLRRELSRTSRFFISTAQRETHGGFLHRTSLPPTLQGFFFSTFADENVDEPDADEPPPPPPPEAAEDEAVLPLQRYGHFAHMLSTSAAPLVDVDPTFSFLTTSLPAADYVHLIHSCNGLLLFGHIEDFLNNLNTLETCFIVCNPATKEWVQGFAPLERWRGHACNAHDNVDFDSPGTVVDGMLYLIYARKWILEVDARAKTRRVMPALGVQRRVLNFFGNHVVSVGQSQGHLHCIVREGHGELVQVNPALQRRSVDVEWVNHGIAIWVLQDCDAQEWVLKGRVNYQKLLGRESCDGNLDYRVAALHPDCNVVFFFQHWDRKIKSYDIDGRDVRALNTDVENSTGSIIPYTPYLSELFLGSIGAHE